MILRYSVKSFKTPLLFTLYSIYITLPRSKMSLLLGIINEFVVPINKKAKSFVFGVELRHGATFDRIDKIRVSLLSCNQISDNQKALGLSQQKLRKM